MRTKYLLVASLILLSVSCHKGSIPKPPPPPPDDRADIATVRLKDVNVFRLPAPFYHFEYNDSGYITHASFSGGLAIYNVVYANKRILRMENTTLGNKDTLKYEYADGNVSVIRIFDRHGVNYRRAFLSYTPSRQLQSIDWEVRMADVGFAQEQTLQFKYYSDGNLKELTTHYFAVGPQTEITFMDTFQNYDDKTNVEAFSLLQPDQNHHLYLLPGVKLQLNNPRQVIRSGEGINYDAEYTYTYDAAGRPLAKAGDVLWKSGQDSGKHFQTQSTFSYYN